MGFVTTTQGLVYFRLVALVPSKVWEYRLEHGNWVKSSEPILLPSRVNVQHDFGISYFSDPQVDPRITLLTGPSDWEISEFQWHLGEGDVGELVIPDSIQKLVDGNFMPTFIGPSPLLGVPTSILGKQWAFVTGKDDTLVELKRDTPTSVWEARVIKNKDIHGPWRDTCLNSKGIHLFTQPHDGTHRILQASRAVDNPDYTVTTYFESHAEMNLSISGAVAAWDEEPRVFFNSERNDGTYIYECVYDPQEKTRKLQELVKVQGGSYIGLIDIGKENASITLAYDIVYGINHHIKTLVWTEVSGWREGPDIDKFKD
ncbi:hypothetical protein IFM58399_10127 [Aspergillus lentulus]|uniref:uncharacterized protein n=1 Tax=Aspergillus lentulus TaxID=293939 RepID=UPI001394A7CD|nr:uncharacterized protein IFM58399_10127 [Aspergillus lentulus]GFF55657.1 hypothetical protein IFM58399_10127 [Aspergillus lentulus]GFF80075.1 hypothetical protein IFM62136_10219 [Aspergillus lentulus]GFF96863.1 hypothetical protein IFM47457_11101 [Aspergillus lentulus]GFG17913.1 hypothetical protein IFM61392_10285 [Aspergillus lentulus]